MITYIMTERGAGAGLRLVYGLVTFILLPVQSLLDPMYGSGGIVYFGSYDRHLYAVDIKTGQEKWRFKTGAGIPSSPAISGGIVYFGSSDGHLYAVK